MTYCSRTILIRKCYLTGQAFTQHSQEKTMEKPYLLDIIQDVLRNLGMKPHMHLVKISIFSLNHAIVRPTKIIKDLRKAST